MFILCGKHLYFLVLNGILIAFVFTRLFFYENKRFGGKGKLLIHFGIQLLLPFVLFSLFTSFYDQNIDRTAYPWGFFQSVTRIEGIFLPLKLPYGQFISIKGSLKTVAFVGLIPALMFIFIKIRMVRVGINRGFKESLNLTGNPTLNLLYWGAFLAFLISLGIPFTLGLENLLNYTGPFRQFRAIGRFILPFYYLLNILSIFFLHKWFFQSGKQYLQVVVLLCLVWFSFDAYLNVKHASNAYINRFEILSLENSAKGDYDWVERHNWENYQVLMPLPYFHIGSENYWISGNAGNHVPSFIASLKTGLPLNAVMLSRTSIKETLKNIELVKEPDNIRILEDLKDQRPFLLISSKGMGLNPNEQRLVQKSILIDENSRFRILELKLDSLKTIQDEYEMEIRSKAKKIIESVNGRTPVLFADYNDLKEGMYIASIKDKSYMHEVKLIDTGWYTVSFHAWDMDKDLWPRTRFNPNQKIKFRYVNKVATNGIMKIDNFLLRKSDEDILQFHNGKYYLNNREVSGIEKESTN